jgi:hypothetical protein
MAARRAGEYLVGVASALMFLSAFAHAWPGWAALRQALPATTDPAVLAAVGIGWHFGSVSMGTFGLLGLVSVAQMRRGYAQSRWTPALIGTAYVLFGIGALASRGFRLHFVFFITLGCLMLAGVLVWSPGQRQAEQGGEGLG